MSRAIADVGAPEPSRPADATEESSPDRLAAAVVIELRRWRFRLDQESVLQDQIQATLLASGFPAEREVRLGPADRIDLMIGAPGTPGVGVEIKIKGQRRAIYRQCLRYCGYERVAALVVVTNAAMGFPATIDRKPLFVVTLGQGWF